MPKASYRLARPKASPEPAHGNCSLLHRFHKALVAALPALTASNSTLNSEVPQTEHKGERHRAVIGVLIFLVMVATAPYANDRTRPRYLTTLKDAAYERVRTISSANLTSVRANNTIITAYYNLTTRRHSHNEYDQILQMLFSNHDPMIIFTSPDLVSTLATWRGKPKRTLVVPLELNETEVAQMGDIVFWEHLGRRFGGANKVDGHQVFWVWNAKTEFLKRGAALNPFQSTFFAWVDAGMVRWDDYTNTTLLQRIPPELAQDQMMILNVTRITHMGRNAMMGAGIFGGYKPGVDRFHEIYMETLQQCAEENEVLATSEQKVMYRTCMEHPGLCLPIRPMFVPHGFDNAIKYPMFYMLAFLNSDKYNRMKELGLAQTTFGDYTEE